MEILRNLDDFEEYSAQLNIETLRESSPVELYHIIKDLREKEADLLRKAYHAEIRKSKVNWNENENTLAIKRLIHFGIIRSYIGSEGKTYKFTRNGKKLAKLLVADYFPYNTYPNQNRATTTGKIYRDHVIKTYYNRKPVTTNSIPTEKIGSYEFKTKLIEFQDVDFSEDDDVGRLKNIVFRETKAAKILKEKVENALKAFQHSALTRILRPVLYNRTNDEIVFMIAFNNQTLYIRGENTTISYLKHKYGENLKFLVNTTHLTKVLSMGANNPALPIMVLDNDNNPIAVLGNEIHLIKNKETIKEIIKTFHNQHELEE